MENDPRVHLAKAAPAVYRSVLALEKEMSAYALAAGIAPGFKHLLLFRASQINGCAYCLRMHGKDALASGESVERLHLLPAWRETSYFSEKEQACLALVEAVTLVSEGQVPDAVYAVAAKVLSPDEIAAVEWIAIVINLWNRIAIASRYPVGP